MASPGAKPKGAQLVGNGHKSLNRLPDSQSPHLIAGENTVQLSPDLTASCIPHHNGISRILHAETMERAQRAMIQRIPQAGH